MQQWANQRLPLKQLLKLLVRSCNIMYTYLKTNSNIQYQNKIFTDESDYYTSCINIDNYSSITLESRKRML